ncbi:hypothetical protein JCM1840_006192 [Sporobolomyces johnsonii]
MGTDGPRACCDEGHGRDFILETPLSKDQIVTALHNAEYICSPPTSLSSASPPPSFLLAADRVGLRVDQPIETIDNLLDHYAVAVPEFEQSTGLDMFVSGIDAGVAFKYQSTIWVKDVLEQWMFTVKNQVLQFPDEGTSVLKEPPIGWA